MAQFESMLCPRCCQPLRLEERVHGAVWRCSRCAGVAANLAVLRRHLEEKVTRDFWRRANQASVPSRRICPSCSRALREFIAFHEQQSLRLDLCRPCQLMWFDRGELEVFPESKKVPPTEIDRQIAIARVEAESAARDYAHRVGCYVEVGFNMIQFLLSLFC